MLKNFLKRVNESSTSVTESKFLSMYPYRSVSIAETSTLNWTKSLSKMLVSNSRRDFEFWLTVFLKASTH